MEEVDKMMDYFARIIRRNKAITRRKKRMEIILPEFCRKAAQGGIHHG